MKKILLSCCLFLIASAAIADSAQARISIFACEPEWASLARSIVKDQAEINVATTADQNPKTVSVRSALVGVARGADMIFCTGGNLEEKWLKGLINRSYNLAAISNDNSLLFAANYAAKPKLAATQSQYMQSGVRVHLNPHNITTIAAEFTRRIKLLDPLHANFYQKNYDEFIKKWQGSIVDWEAKSQVLRGRSFLANDNSWTYLADWLDLDIRTIVDPETGAKPTILRLTAVADNLRAKPVEAIIFARWEDKKSIVWIQNTLNIRVVMVPHTTRGPMDLTKMFDGIINALLTDCSSGVCKSLINPEKKTVKLL